MSEHTHTCPKCGGHRFDISVQNIATVRFDADGDHEVEGTSDEAQWDDTSVATCSGCGHTDSIKAMETRPCS